MLTKETSIRFLNGKFGVEDFEAKFKNNKLQLLNQILAGFQSTIPFNNFGLLATEPHLRKNPEADDALQALLEGYGGVCIVNNGAFASLLESLGFDVIRTDGRVLDCEVPGSHITVLVANVQKPGDLFYCDAGFGYPSFEALSLTSGLPHVVQLSFHHLKLEKIGDTFIRSVRYTPVLGDMNEDAKSKWRPFLTFKTTPRSFSYFDEAMREMFTNQSRSIFLNVVYGTLFGPLVSITVKDLTLRIWKKDTAVVEKLEFRSIEEASHIVAKHFPMIAPDVITKCYRNWKAEFNPQTAEAVQQQH